MSAPKLPPSSVSQPQSASSAAPRQGPGKSKDQTVKSLKASIAPLAAGIATVSLGIALLGVVTASLAGSNVVTLGLLGYFLSGFATPLLWGWDAAAQRRGQVNPNFSAKRQYSFVLRILALTGVVVAIVHLFFVSTVIAERLSEWMFLAGLVEV